METLTIIERVIAGISILITAVSLCYSCFKSKKSKNANGEIIINSMLPNLILTAETLFGEKKGIAKLDYVKTQVKLFALEHGFKIDEEKLTTSINAIVDMTKHVNINSKAKTDAVFCENQQVICEDKQVIEDNNKNDTII